MGSGGMWVMSVGGGAYLFFCSVAEERTGSREHEVASLRGQLSAVEAQVEQEGRVRAGLQEELNGLKSDLGMMTQENQSLHQELRRAGQEQEALAERVRQYTQSIQRFEEAVAAKVGWVEHCRWVHGKRWTVAAPCAGG